MTTFAKTIPRKDFIQVGFFLLSPPWESSLKKKNKNTHTN
jgi:hypothetical protein